MLQFSLVSFSFIRIPTVLPSAKFRDLIQIRTTCTGTAEVDYLQRYYSGGTELVNKEKFLKLLRGDPETYERRFKMIQARIDEVYWVLLFTILPCFGIVTSTIQIVIQITIILHQVAPPPEEFADDLERLKLKEWRDKFGGYRIFEKKTSLSSGGWEFECREFA